jgi:hypothetical protein
VHSEISWPSVRPRGLSVFERVHPGTGEHSMETCHKTRHTSILKGSDDSVMHFEESCFWTLSIVQCFSLKTTFRRLALLPSSGKWGEDTYSVGSLVDC